MPKTDWTLIRAMMETAIGACEKIEAMGYTERDRETLLDVAGHPVSVHDFMTSAWTLPESMRYQIIRDRHDAGTDLPYVPEYARILLAMAQASAELIGGKDSPTSEAAVQQMLDWYRLHALPHLRRAIDQPDR